ncbi:MAG TPA: 3-hydroxyacyl-CoA dehydrogenase family protein, partial [Solirubrobacterales bacterium]|nr:3-hydroxyacyl-CoA dehydrogenase family protein [Solirubrobacterales bacterium]
MTDAGAAETEPNHQEPYCRVGIAGSGAIACGLAATATVAGDALLLARSAESAERARERAAKLCAKLDDANADRVRVTTDPADLADCDLVVESVVEDLEVKAELLGRLSAAAPETDLATTTSSLSIAALAERIDAGPAGDASGVPAAERLFGLHVFNPVPRMKLIEVCLPPRPRAGLHERALAWCEAIGKTAVEVPDQAGFVVNRLLFPYLFDAARLLESSGMEPGRVDACMTLGAGHPMGPLALLDFIGLDVAAA